MAGGYDLFLSKDADNLPISTIRPAATEPCMDPFRVARGPEQMFFVGEFNDRVKGCTQVNINSDGSPLLSDGRYSKTGLSATEYSF